MTSVFVQCLATNNYVELTNSKHFQNGTFHEAIVCIPKPQTVNSIELMPLIHISVWLSSKLGKAKYFLAESDTNSLLQEMPNLN